MAGTSEETPAPRRAAPSARRLRGMLANCAGVAAVEFGLALPVFLLFIFGTIEFSRVLWSWHALGYVAEQATRYALAHPSATFEQIEAYAGDQVMTVERSAVTITAAQEDLDGITYLRVTVTYPFQAILPFVPLGSLDLRGVSRIPLNV